MKRIFLTVFILSVVTSSQFKEKDIFKPNVKDAITSSTSNLIFGFIDPDNFSMNHSFNLSYSAFGSNSLALSVYTNKMMYKFSDNLNLQVDASIVQSPYSSFGKNFQNQISGIYLSRAQLSYNPWENFNITVLYSQLPNNYYSPYYNGNYGFGFNRFTDDFFFGR